MSDSEVSLSQWAKDNHVSYRTAIQWANDGKIPAVRKNNKVRVVVNKSVYGYYLPASTPVPDNNPLPEISPEQ